MTRPSSVGASRTWRVITSRTTYLVVSILGLLLHLLATPELYGFADRLLAWVLLNGFLVSTYWFLVRKVRTAPIVPMLLLQLYLGYGLAHFTQTRIHLVSGYYTPPPEAITAAMLIVVASMFGFLLAHRLGSVVARSVVASPLSRFPTPNGNWRHGVILFAVLALAELYISTQARNALPLEARNFLFVVLSPNLALVLALYMAYRYKMRVLFVLAAALAGAMVLAALISSMLEGAVVALYVLAAAAWMWGDLVNVRWVVAGLAIFLVLNPVKQRYRALAWRDEFGVSSVSDLDDRFSKWQRAFISTWNDPFASEKGLETTGSRASAILTLAQTVDWVPAVIPHKEGEGFESAVLFFIPRAIWPDKPKINDSVNLRYAIEFRVTTPNGATNSTFGMSQPADGYWDFGVAGAIGYLSITGFIIGYLFGGRRGTTPIEEILALLFSALFFQSLTNLFFLIASLFSWFAGAYVALKLISMLSRKATPEDQRAAMISSIPLSR